MIEPSPAMAMTNQFLLGAIALACFAIALFFLRYWRSSGDRFFAFFALSFLIEAANRIYMAASQSWSENAPLYYSVRLLSYGLILYAIWDKNRPGRK